MPDDAREKNDERSFLALLGKKLRTLRAQRGTPRRHLAAQADISDRYLAKLESGEANPSIAILGRIADVINLPLEALVSGCQGAVPDRTVLIEMISRLDKGQLFEATTLIKSALMTPAPDGRAKRISLIGLRGAGKSTLGRRLAEHLGVPLLELTRLVEDSYGAAISELLSFSGQAGYRRYERRALLDVISEHTEAVIPTGGGIVTDAETYTQLLERTHCIWLKAEPEEHMQRVLNQGDLRPMTDNKASNIEAMDDLRAILAARTPLYSQAETVLDTSGQSEDDSFDRLLSQARGCFDAN